MPNRALLVAVAAALLTACAAQGPATTGGPAAAPMAATQTKAQRLNELVEAYFEDALGLTHGPVHAECRLNESGVFVLEVAPRPIGGLCARALRFRTASREGITLEELLLRHALGEALDGYGRERAAAGVMMVPIPRRGRFRDVQGLDAARLVPGVEGIVITAKPGQLIVPPPDGGSYLGFVFARATGTADVVEALRASHAALQFSFESDLPLSGG